MNYLDGNQCTQIQCRRLNKVSIKKIRPLGKNDHSLNVYLLFVFIVLCNPYLSVIIPFAYTPFLDYIIRTK